MIIPYLRKIRILLTIGQDIVEFTSNGLPNSLKVTCNISKTVMGIPNPSTISIFNLSSETRNAIRKNLSKIEVYAGWENTEEKLVLAGNVMSCYSERNGADIVSKLAVLQGYSALSNAVSSITFAEGTPVVDAVRTLASDLEGVTISEDKLKGIDGVIGYSGWSFAGSTKDALNQLASEYGFSWSVDDDNLNAIGDKAQFNGMVVLNGNKGGLISVVPILNGPMQIQTGVKIKALFVPGTNPGTSVEVKSSISEGLDGVYRVHTVNYSLDTFSSSWTMDIESFSYL